MGHTYPLTPATQTSTIATIIICTQCLGTSCCGSSMTMRLSIYPGSSCTPPFHSFFSFVLWLSTMNKALSIFLENKISLELPLKHPEVYCVTYTPEFPGLLISTIVLLLSNVCILTLQMIEIQPSTSTSKLQNTTDKSTPQSPSGMYIPPPPIFAYLFLDACHFRALENEKLLCSLNQSTPPLNNLVSSILQSPKIKN